MTAPAELVYDPREHRDRVGDASRCGRSAPHVSRCGEWAKGGEKSPVSVSTSRGHDAGGRRSAAGFHGEKAASEGLKDTRTSPRRTRPFAAADTGDDAVCECVGVVYAGVAGVVYAGVAVYADDGDASAAEGGCVVGEDAEVVGDGDG